MFRAKNAKARYRRMQLSLLARDWLLQTTQLVVAAIRGNQRHHGTTVEWQKGCTSP